MISHSKRIAIIGGGNMARAMLAGLLQQGVSPNQLWVTRRSAEKLAEIEATFGVHVTTDNVAAVSAADVVVLCVKPWQAAKVCAQLQPVLSARRVLVISVMTGVTLGLFATWLGDRVPVVRAMPNTPSQYGWGVTGFSTSTAVTQPEHDDAQTLLSTLGETFYFAQECDLDAVTALTGSGPAYVLLFMEALQAVAASAGIDVAQAAPMIEAMVIGTAKMAQASPFTLSALRDSITSKGGTTEQALRVLQEGDFSQLLHKAFHAARARAQEITLELQQGAH